MFGIKFIKVQPTTYLLQYRGGKMGFVDHLTALFEHVWPTELLEWAFWSYADLDQPSEMTAASEAVRVANWVVFCQATPAA